MSNAPVYLDNHATTQPDPRVVDAMLPYFTTHYGNASSISHRFGWEAADAVETARDQLARLLNAGTKEIIFTSGATEANNLALKGALSAARRRGNHVITAAAEHKSVLDPLKRLAREGMSLTVLPVDAYGSVAPEAVEAAFTDETVLVSIMAANNEVGTLNPIHAIGALCRRRGVLFHTDATQAVGKVPLDLQDGAVDLLSLSAHKFHGPKGIGALFVRREGGSVRLVPLLDGGGHERGLRSGTLAVPLIVGLGKAAELARLEGPDDAVRLARQRERLHQGLRERAAPIQLNGHPTERLPNNLNVSFPGVNGEALMMNVRAIAVSSGAACSTAEPEPSHVLRAMRVDSALAGASLRFGLGRFTTDADIEVALNEVERVVQRLRAG